MPSVFGELIDHEPFMVQSTLADQGLCQLQPDGQIAASCIRSHQQKRLFGILSVVIRIEQDRKSTRLNSSHGYISYAVFCLKKKKTYPARRPASSSQTFATRV